MGNEKLTEMILLQSFDSYDEMADFDPFSHRLNRWSKRLNPKKPITPYLGHFSMMMDNPLIFYRDSDGLLHFLGHGSDIVVDDNLSVHLEKENFSNLAFCRDGFEILSIRYRRKKISPPLETDLISCFVEEEDFDFGLFVYNVLTDSGRRSRIYQAHLMPGEDGR